MAKSLYSSENQLSDGSYNLGTLDAAVVTASGLKKITPVTGKAVKQTRGNTYTVPAVSSLSSPNQVVQQKSSGVPINSNLNTSVKSPSFGQQLNSGLGSKIGQGVIGAAGSALDIAKGFVPTQESKGKNPTGFETQQAIGDALTKVPIPIVQAAGLAYKGISMLAEATGGNTNSITKEQAEDLGISKGTRLANNIIGALHPGAGWLVKEVEEGQKSHLIDEMSNAYADTVADIDQAGVLGGGKYLFGSKKVANAVSEANRRNELLTEMNMTNTMRKQSDYGKDLAQQNMNRYAGTNYMDMRMGRKGMKIQSLEEIRELLKNRVVEELDVQKFAEGGSILPVGQRHKTLHHMDELGEQFEDLTRKGIPVVTVDESGGLTQVAEIECMEWTISKSLTDEIETLWKDGSEEAMIECGKLVCEHLLRQTKDEGGILDE